MCAYDALEKRFNWKFYIWTVIAVSGTIEYSIVVMYCIVQHSRISDDGRRYKEPVLINCTLYKFWTRFFFWFSPRPFTQLHSIQKQKKSLLFITNDSHTVSNALLCGIRSPSQMSFALVCAFGIFYSILNHLKFWSSLSSTWPSISSRRGDAMEIMKTKHEHFINCYWVWNK